MRLHGTTLLFLFFFFLLLLRLHALPHEREALIHLKRRVTSDPSRLLFSWTPPTDHCSWRFVSCDNLSRVVSLDLSPAARSVVLPRLPRSIRWLTRLRVLSLPSLGLRGPFPQEIVSLSSLEVLDLSGNSLSGPLPPRLPLSLRVVQLRSNGLRGGVPHGIKACRKVELLDFSDNRLSGTIPPSLLHLDRLRRLNLSFNRLVGAIPAEIGDRCGQLEQLLLSGNRLSGCIPASLGNCSQLRSLVLSSNLLGGEIPKEIGRLRKLELFDVSRNKLSGVVPAEIGECLELAVIVLSEVSNAEHNQFRGSIDGKITSLPKLRMLWAPRASLEGRIPGDWGSCTSLEAVHLGGNLLTGVFPRGFSCCSQLKYLNLSSNALQGGLDAGLPVACMDVFDVSENQLSGSIPNFNCDECSSSSSVIPGGFPAAYSSLFSMNALLDHPVSHYGLGSGITIFHDFASNNFTGGIPFLPVARHRLENRVTYALFLSKNKLSGSFPHHLVRDGELLGGLVLDISDNLVSGMIPPGIGLACGSLVVLNASGNKISGTMPYSLGLCGALKYLDLSRNQLQGNIPGSLGLLSCLKHLFLAGNELVGGIPSSLGQLSSLEVLDLSFNSLSGGIPTEFIALGNISILLLNNNKFSGRFPMFIVTKTSISVLNLSHNNLSEPLPLSITRVICSFSFGKLMFRPCPEISSFATSVKFQGRRLETTDSGPPTGKNNGFTSIEIASISSASAIVSVLFTLIIIYIYTRKCAPNARVQAAGKKEVTVFMNIGVPLTYENVVRATGNFNASNCIGSGGFGATYKAEIAPGVIVAIKRLFVGKIQGVQQFHAEIKTLGRWHHPNLVTLIGFHVSESEMFLIYNYLPGGNLEKFIRNRHKRPVNWKILHKIALDVACALAYLHDQCIPRILHRDVKPSNILLDNDFNAYLSDFGLARLLGNSETHATTGVAGTFGYVAPEYAMTCRVSDKADVYSYGVVLLELLSDKKALDPSFSPYGNGFNIVAWATMLLKRGKAREFFTEGLWDVGPSDDLIDTLHLALRCTVDSLTNRPTMKQVVQLLKKIQP